MRFHLHFCGLCVIVVVDDDFLGGIIHQPLILNFLKDEVVGNRVLKRERIVNCVNL